MKLLAPALLVVPLVGCGSPPAGPPKTDDDFVRAFVSRMPDAANDPKRFKEFWASGASVPADAQRQRYAKYHYEAGRPSIQGDTATVTVKVKDDDRPDPLGTVEWAFVKEGGRWKVKAAPLP
jgi:hypothetical protein